MSEKEKKEEIQRETVDGNDETVKKQKTGMNIFSCFRCFWRTQEDQEEAYCLSPVAPPVHLQVVDLKSQDVANSLSRHEINATSKIVGSSIICSNESLQDPASFAVANQQMQNVLLQSSRKDTMSLMLCESFQENVRKIIASPMNQLHQAQLDLIAFLDKLEKSQMTNYLTLLKVMNTPNPVLNKVIAQVQLTTHHQRKSVQGGFKTQNTLETVQQDLVPYKTTRGTLSHGYSHVVCLHNDGFRCSANFHLSVKNFDWMISLILNLINLKYEDGGKELKMTRQKSVGSLDLFRQGEIEMEVNFVKIFNTFGVDWDSISPQLQRPYLQSGWIGYACQVNRRSLLPRLQCHVGFSAQMLLPLDIERVIIVKSIDILHHCVAMLLKSNGHNKENTELVMQVDTKPNDESASKSITMEPNIETQISRREKSNTIEKCGFRLEHSLIQDEETDGSGKNHFTWIAINENAFEACNNKHSSVILDYNPTFNGTWMIPVKTQGHLNFLKVTPFERLSSLWIEQSTVAFFRSIKGFPFAPVIDTRGRKCINQIMQMVAKALDCHFINVTTDDIYEKEIYKKYRSQLLKPKPYARNDWPDDRAIHVPKEFNKNKQIVVKVNYEEHLEFRCQTRGGALKQALVEVLKIEQIVREALNDMNVFFCHHEKYGYLDSNLGHLGMGMKIMIQMNIPLLQEHFFFDEFLKYYALKRSYYGRKKGQTFNILELETKEQFAISEVENMCKVYDAADRMIKIERRLEYHKDFECVLPDVLKETYHQMCCINTGNRRKQLRDEKVVVKKSKHTSEAIENGEIKQDEEIDARPNGSKVELPEDNNIRQRKDQGTPTMLQKQSEKERNGRTKTEKLSQSLQDINVYLSAPSRPMPTSERRLRFGEGRNYHIHPERHLSHHLGPDNRHPSLPSVYGNSLLQTRIGNNQNERHQFVGAQRHSDNPQRQYAHQLVDDDLPSVVPKERRGNGGRQRKVQTWKTQ